MHVLRSHRHWNKAFQQADKSEMRCNGGHWRCKSVPYFPLLFLSLLSDTLLLSATNYTHFPITPTAAPDVTYTFQFSLLFLYMSSSLLPWAIFVFFSPLLLSTLWLRHIFQGGCPNSAFIKSKGMISLSYGKANGMWQQPSAKQWWVVTWNVIISSESKAVQGWMQNFNLS